MPQLLIIGHGAWWTSINLFSNAINDKIIVSDIESGFQCIIFSGFMLYANQHLAYLFFDIESFNQNGWKCISCNNFPSIMNYLNTCMSLYSSMDVSCLFSLNSYH